MARTKKAVADGNSVVAYVRVSTGEQADSGLGMKAQRSAIKAEADRRGWTIVAWHEDAGISAKTLERPGLTAALADVEQGRAAALVVSKLDRLSRSLLDFASLMARSQKAGWSLVALDLGVDTSTPSGEMMASVLATFAQFERRLIGQRTKSALAEKKAAGIVLGRPSGLPTEIVERIVNAHDAGAGWSDIARQLQADEVPTSRDKGPWYPSSVKAVYDLARARSA